MNLGVYEIFSVKDKVIIITGGAGFLGMQYAKALANAGAKVILWDKRNPSYPGGDNYYSNKIYNIIVDITDEKVVREAAQNIIDIFGRIDVLINNAAMNPAVGSEESRNMFVPYDEYPLESFKREIEVNLIGPFICAKAVIPVMKKQIDGGVIINVASEVSNIAHDHRVYNNPDDPEELKNKKYKSPAYTASKTGLVGLTRQMAAALGQYHIRVNAISPGGVRGDNVPADFAKRFGATNMLGRMAERDEYIATIIYLCSDASSFVTGANFPIDGGKSAW